VLKLKKPSKARVQINVNITVLDYADTRVSSTRTVQYIVHRSNSIRTNNAFSTYFNLRVLSSVQYDTPTYYPSNYSSTRTRVSDLRRSKQSSTQFELHSSTRSEYVQYLYKYEYSSSKGTITVL
jgi:hypothetical protein